MRYDQVILRDQKYGLRIKKDFRDGVLAAMEIKEKMESGPASPLTNLYTCGMLAQCVGRTNAPYLEIGSRYGGSVVLAAQFLPEDQPLYCVDPMEAARPHHGNEAGQLPIFKANMRKFGLTKRVHLTQASSRPFPLRPEWQFGVTFIDGDHSFEMALNDFMSAALITSHYIVMDDALSTGVRDVVQYAVANREELGWHLVHLNFTTAVFVREWHLQYRVRDLGFI